jgi:hypothetical protein
MRCAFLYIRRPRSNLNRVKRAEDAPHFVAAGAANDSWPAAAFLIKGWWMDRAFTKRSLQFD